MAKADQLWARYWAIRDRHQNGHRMPILWHLALRGDAHAMTELGSTFDRPGRIADAFSQNGLAYRAFRRGYGGSQAADASRRILKFEVRLARTVL